MNGGEVLNPVLQILGHKKIAGNSPTDRYRLLISDGVHLNSFAMLATQLNDKITAGELAEYSIVQINRHVVSMVNSNQGKSDRRLMIILDLTVLQHGSEVSLKIGNPVPYTGEEADKPAANQPSANQPPKPNTPVNNGGGGGFGAGRQVMKASNQASAVEGSPMAGQRTHPIAYLSPYQNKWVIKARVLSKTAVKTWSNARGEGKLFSMDLADESGEIRLTAFRDQVDKFFDMIEVDKVYLISRCQLKQANKKFTSLKNDYEMTCTSETRIEPCTDDCGDIPKMKFNFTSLVALQEANLENSVDVIGVCKRIGDLATVIQRTTNKELKKRDIELVDNSLSSISVTLWNADAENFEINGNDPIVAIRQAGLSDFGGGRSLSVRVNSLIQINPDIPEAHKLRGWYDALSHDAKFNSLSTRGGGMDGGMTNSKAITLKEAKNQNSDSDKAEYFSTFAHIMHIRTENFCYKACPSADCNKKVVDLNTGEYRCEKCNRASPNFKYRLLLNMQIADISDAQWVSCFQEVAEQTLNSTADEIGNMLGDEKAIEQLFQVPLFSCYNIRLRSKIETFNDEMRRKVVVVSMKPVDNAEYANFLLKELQEMTGVSTSN